MLGEGERVGEGGRGVAGCYHGLLLLMLMWLVVVVRVECLVDGEVCLIQLLMLVLA